MTDGKEHMSIVICGHVDSGKSTTTGRLLFELGGIEEREMEKLKDEANKIGKGSFAFAFFMDRQKEERDRGVTISCTTKEFFTDNWHYTIIDAPGHRDFIKNMISGAAQADVALIMVPADGNFTTAIQKGNHKQGLVQGQTRQHARLINLLGVKQIVVGVNKMDADVAGYKQERFEEVKNEMLSVMGKIGYKKDWLKSFLPVLPLSGWKGDNLIEKSKNMEWWKGCACTNSKGEKVTVTTLLQCLNDVFAPPKRETDKALRLPISGIYKIKGVGDVLAGRVEQGEVKPGSTVRFMPTHTKGVPCTGKVFTVEMHHKPVEKASPGDNVGLNMKGLKPENMPHSGDVMVTDDDKDLRHTKTFDAQIQTLDIPGQLKVGYSPIGFVRTGRAACSIMEITWKMGKETGGKKVEGPPYIKSNEMAAIKFKPMQPFACEPFKMRGAQPRGFPRREHCGDAGQDPQSRVRRPMMMSTAPPFPLSPPPTTGDAHPRDRHPNPSRPCTATFL